MVAVIGHELIAQGIETSRDSAATKICRGLWEMDDAEHCGLSKLRIGDAFYLFLWLRGNAFAHVELTKRSGRVERQAITFCVERLPDGLRNRLVGQRADTLHFVSLSSAEQ